MNGFQRRGGIGTLGTLGRPLPRGRAALLVGAALALTAGCALPALASAAAPVRPAALVPAAASSDWPTYQENTLRTGYNANETTLTASTVGKLKKVWGAGGSGDISDQPAESGGDVYWGSWNGDVHAATVAGKTLWTTPTGTSSHSDCDPATAGVASSGAVGTAGSTPALFIGGGNSTVDALNLATGKILWSTRLGTLNSAFTWSSPTLYGGDVYIGIASLGDCPLIQGKLFKISEATGAVLGTLDIVPNGCLGGGIWDTPSIDSSGNLYTATGNPNRPPCTGGVLEPYGSAVLKVSTSTMKVESFWALPTSETKNADIEFGSSPTLFPAVVGGATHQYVGVGAKDGNFYAFDTANVAHGPVWKYAVDKGGDGPQSGMGVLSPAAFDGHDLYIAGGTTTISGKSCTASIRALNPANGAAVWQTCLSGAILGPVAAIPGVAFVAGGHTVTAVATSNGKVLYQLDDTTKGSLFYGGPSVARGMVFVGNMDGSLFALGL